MIKGCLIEIDFWNRWSEWICDAGIVFCFDANQHIGDIMRGALEKYPHHEKTYHT